MNKYIFFTLLFFTTWLKTQAFSFVDSVGTEIRNGKIFVIHKVVPSETVYALSRKYKVPVPEIMTSNPNIDKGIIVGQLVYIPRATKITTVKSNVSIKPVNTPVKPAEKPITVPKTITTDATGNIMHLVTDKQTLFSIARQYKVSTNDLKKWNKLTSDQVKVGDNLIVSLRSTLETTTPVAPEPVESSEKPKPTPVKPVISEKSEPKVTPKAPEKEEEKPASETSTETISKITENGLAEVIDGRIENGKYLALHNSAPIGTILQVKNTNNNQSVYVRVTGKLPANGTNQKVIIKLSKRAYQKLSSSDNRLPVEVSYMP